MRAMMHPMITNSHTAQITKSAAQRVARKRTIATTHANSIQREENNRIITLDCLSVNGKDIRYAS